ncbi:MAG: hypothetical protein IJX96_03165 [Clostridia bacterium]|nr:hypothetical protein [Clostridia bacterium]
MEKFAIGLLLGGVCGALVATNNYKMRSLVKKSQEEVQAKLDELLDEKLRAFDEMSEDDEADEPKPQSKPRKSRAKKSEN